MLGIVGRHWRGDARLWTALIACTLMIPAVVGVAALFVVGSLAVDHAPRVRIVENILGFGLVGIVCLWQLVGTWRASSSVRTPQSRFVTRWFARLLALIVAAAGGAMVATIPNGVAQLSALANGTDPIGRGGYRVAVQGDTLTYQGYFAWPALDEIQSALAASPQIRTVVLNSPGGIVPVGSRFADIVRSRGLDTWVAAECSSACTLVFLAGKRRALQGRGRLGFHAVATVFGDNASARAAAQLRAEAALAAHRLPADFIARVSNTPASSMWYPTADELRRAGVVTDLVR